MQIELSIIQTAHTPQLKLTKNRVYPGEIETMEYKMEQP